jgi:hypothetical protein
MYNTIHLFLKLSLNSEILVGTRSIYSLRISYRGSNNNKLKYTTVFFKNNAKDIDYEKKTEEVIQRLNNRRIALSSIKRLHMHLH